MKVMNTVTKKVSLALASLALVATLSIGSASAQEATPTGVIVPASTPIAQVIERANDEGFPWGLLGLLGLGGLAGLRPKQETHTVTRTVDNSQVR